MKTKRLIALFVFLVFLTTVFVLGSTVFVVKNISVANETELTETDLNDIINASNIKKGKSVFTISESRVVRNIEAKVHNIRVINIERVFPNKIIIHTALRVPVIALKVSDRNEILVLDENMNVVKMISESESADLSNLCLIENYVLSGTNAISLGSQLSESFGKSVVCIQHILKGLEQAGLKNNQLTKFLKNIRFQTIKSENDRIYVLTKSGVEIVLNANEMTEDNFILVNRTKQAFDAYKNLNGTNITNGFLEYDNRQNEFVWKEKI